MRFPALTGAASAALIMLALLVAPAPARAQAQAAQYFLQLDGIQGDSTDAKYPFAIVLLGYSLGGDDGRSEGASIKVTKYLDRASPKLWLANLTGTHIRSATLTSRRPPPSGFVFAEVKLQDVIIARYVASSSQQGQTEEVTLQGAKAQFCQKAQKADGSPGASVCGCWDFKMRGTCSV
ncbi:hypothetical protein ABPG75_011984 [Micractinium tetrahymenae]